MFKRKDSVTYGQLTRAELGETVGHARRAAGHAAGGLRDSVGPRVAPATERMRQVAADRLASYGVALVPLGEQASTKEPRASKAGSKMAKMPKMPKAPGSRAAGATRDGSTAKTRNGSRLPRKAAMLAGGVALGAFAAYLLRQQRQQQWGEFEATEPAEPVVDEEEEAMTDVRRPAGEWPTGDESPPPHSES